MKMPDLRRRMRAGGLSMTLAAVIIANALFTVPVYADTISMTDLCAGEARIIQNEYFSPLGESPEEERASAEDGTETQEPAPEAASSESTETEGAASEADTKGASSLSSTSVSASFISRNIVVKINNVEELSELAGRSAVEEYTKNKTFELTSDIDLTDQPDVSFPAFFGTFDGKGHVISGVTFDEEGYNSGLFRYVRQGAVIRNLEVKASITVSDDSLITGGICGINEGIISDCVFKGDIKGRNITGGIAAINEVPGTIIACENRASVSGYYFTGGICGKNYGVVAYSYNHGAVNNTLEWVEVSDEIDPAADRMSAILSGGYHKDSEETFNRIKGMDTGGIAGYSTGAIFQSENYGDIGYEHSGYNVGGIVGRQAGFVSWCNNSGNIYGRKDIGGIVGQMEPYLTLEDLETLPDAVDKLHDLVDKSLDDVHDASDTMTDDMKLLSEYAKNAVDAGDALTTTGKDYLNRVGDAADSLQARVDYLSESMPDILDDLDEVREDFHDTSKTIRKLLNDGNVVDRLSPSENEALEKAKKELEDRSFKNIGDRAEAIREILSIIIPESIDASGDVKQDIKKLYNRMDDLSDSFHDTTSHTTDVFDHLNGMPKPSVPRLGEDFDFAKETLRLNLDAMSDTLSALSDHSDNSSDKLTDDFHEVNDQVNVVFHIISDELDRIGDITRGETDELIRDVSEEEIEAIEQGRVDHCVNKGIIKGDIDIGGIGGAMFIDSEDPEENAAGNLDGGFTDKYMLRNIILKCENEGRIESKKDGAGGIVGYMGHGIVAGCESYGAVTSTEGSYVGGIAGQSFSIIKDSAAMSYLDAASYVGGITGFGTTINGCSAIPVFESRSNRSGSIAGQIDAEKDTHMQHLEVISGNKYVNDDIAGIDYFSMTDIAEPVSYEELLRTGPASKGFKEIPVIFITIDEEDKSEIIDTVRLPYGTALSSITFPGADIEEEEYIKWPDFAEGEVLTLPLPIKGVIMDMQKTLASGEKYPDTEYPAALVSGIFTREDSLAAALTIPDNMTVEYNVAVEADNASSVSSLRIYNPFKKYELYGIDDSGNEHKLESSVKGSYAEYKGYPEYTHFRLKDKSLINRIKAFFGR